jgi:hypothetical protein
MFLEGSGTTQFSVRAMTRPPFTINSNPIHEKFAEGALECALKRSRVVQPRSAAWFPHTTLHLKNNQKKSGRRRKENNAKSGSYVR